MLSPNPTLCVADRSKRKAKAGLKYFMVEEGFLLKHCSISCNCSCDLLYHRRGHSYHTVLYTIKSHGECRGHLSQAAIINCNSVVANLAPRPLLPPAFHHQQNEIMEGNRTDCGLHHSLVVVVVLVASTKIFLIKWFWGIWIEWFDKLLKTEHDPLYAIE